MSESAYSLTDEERQWLVGLDEELWPKEDPREAKKQKIKLEANRALKWSEFQKILKIVEERRLLTSMFCTSMFGGYGMDVFEHEPFPGAGPLHLLRLVEGHHPDPHRLEVGEGYDKHVRKQPGVGRDDAWESFSKFTHSEMNKEWLKSYRMEPPQSRGSYDY